MFDILKSPDVSGLASDEAAPVPVACGGRSDCRVLSSFLILFERVQHMFIIYIGFERFLFYNEYWGQCWVGADFNIIELQNGYGTKEAPNTTVFGAE